MVLDGIFGFKTIGITKNLSTRLSDYCVVILCGELSRFGRTGDMWGQFKGGI